MLGLDWLDVLVLVVFDYMTPGIPMQPITETGVHPKIVQEQLGHANIAMTLDLYSHTIPGMQKAAALAFDKAIKESVSESNSLESH